MRICSGFDTVSTAQPEAFPRLIGRRDIAAFDRGVTMTGPNRAELSAALKSTQVGELILETRPALKASDSAADAAAAMRQVSHGSALVCDDDGQLIGIVTERDLLRVLAAEAGLDVPLSDVMTADPRTLSRSDSLRDAVRFMSTGGYRRLPVVDDQNRAVGILDVKDVVHFLVELYPSAVYNQASHDQLIARNREGA